MIPGMTQTPAALTPDALLMHHDTGQLWPGPQAALIDHGLPGAYRLALQVRALSTQAIAGLGTDDIAALTGEQLGGISRWVLTFGWKTAGLFLTLKFMLITIIFLYKDCERYAIQLHTVGERIFQHTNV